MKNEDKLFLIVDDEPDMCWALEYLLKKIGFLSEKVLNGREALKLMKKNHFLLAFLDAKLPDIEGLELARRIREIDPSIGIVIVSGYFYRDDTDIRDALSEGLISGFIAKPFSHEEILEIVGGISSSP